METASIWECLCKALQRSYKEDNWGNQVSSVWEAVKKRDRWKRVGRRELEPGSRGILLVSIKYLNHYFNSNFNFILNLSV
jgi:hypothetical protein